MRKLMFAVYDSKAEAFYAPFPSEKRQMAVRWFSELVNDETQLFGKHPEDFTLFEVGEFEDADGQMIPRSTPAAVVTALAVKRKDS